MPAKQIFGLSCALVTPFRPDGEIDRARLVTHARQVLAEGCDTVTVFGTTGEGFGLSVSERASVLGALEGSGTEPAKFVYAGVSAVTFDDAVEQSRLALDAGARGLLFAPPFYFKGLDDEGLYAWFSRAIERIGASARGIILYHIPGQTSVPISVDLVGRLKKAFPGTVVGVKDSSGQWDNAEAFLAEHGELAILVGDERMLGRAMRKGAEGSICGLANTAAGLLRPVIYDGVDSSKVNELVDMITGYPVLPTVKALVAHVRNDPEFVRMRPPLSDLPTALRLEAAAAFDRIMST